ncbi:hypothetical protein ABXV23_26320, partial [Vibrio owensii]|uniref:hypothetical protein n=1 Tax=Vibrio owensii TaxID=696485 RepID=UPI0033974F0D
PRYFTTVYFTEEQPIRQKTVEIVVPKWMHVDIKEMNFAGNRIIKAHQSDDKKGVDIYTYTISNLAAFIKERNSPGPTYIYPHLLILSKYAELKTGRQQYFNELKDQYAWYRSLVLQVNNDTAVMKAKAAEITKGITG